MASYIKRGNKWQYEISYKKDDGKFTKIRKSGFKTKKAAMAAAQEVESNINKGFKADTDDMLLSDFFWQWFELYKKGTLAPTTEAKYRDTHGNIKKLAPYQTVKTLDRAKFQSIINEYGKNHTKETVVNFKNHIKASLQDAVYEGYIPVNPSNRIVIRGSVQAKPKSEKFISFEDSKRLIHYLNENLEGNKISNHAILLAAVTGMRVGEILGLTWDCFDLNKRKINIEKSWDYKFHTGFIQLKTDSSSRIIYVDQHTCDIFSKFKQTQKDALSRVDVENKDNHVFYSAIHKVPTSAALNKQLKRILTKLEISPIITMHGLRHTMASLLLYKGVSVFKVSKMLGHSNVSITQEIYTHIIKELDEAENEKINAAQNSLFE